MQSRIYANHQIRAKEVRLIDEEGKQLGVVPLEEALRLGQERGLDVIQVTEKVDPPVCRLGDYGKFLYQKEKRDRVARKHGGGGEVKEVRLTYNISTHDLATRAKQATKFLSKGDKIRITLPLRGRQKAHETVGAEKINILVQELQKEMELKIEREIKREPRGLSMIVAKA